jgi:legumain
VITGKKYAMKDIGTGKVLESDSNSKVFINFSDHGAPGLIAFPSSYLYADDLNDALSHMY